jgi:hypothetical protein
VCPRYYNDPSTLTFHYFIPQKAPVQNLGRETALNFSGRVPTGLMFDPFNFLKAFEYILLFLCFSRDKFEFCVSDLGLYLRAQF